MISIDVIENSSNEENLNGLEESARSMEWFVLKIPLFEKFRHMPIQSDHSIG
jgi:hypothetical protein